MPRWLNSTGTVMGMGPLVGAPLILASTHQRGQVDGLAIMFGSAAAMLDVLSVAFWIKRDLLRS